MHSQNGASFLPLFVLFFSCFRQKRGFFSSQPYDKRLRFHLLIFLTRFLTWHFWHFPPSFSFHVKTLDVFGVANKDGSPLRTPGFKFLRQNQQQLHSWLHEGRGLERPHFTSFDMRIEFEIIHFFYFPLRVVRVGNPVQTAIPPTSVQKCPSITVSLPLDRPLWLWPFTQAQNPLKVALGGRRRRREAFCCCWMQIETFGSPTVCSKIKWRFWGHLLEHTVNLKFHRFMSFTSFFKKDNHFHVVFTCQIPWARAIS